MEPKVYPNWSYITLFFLLLPHPSYANISSIKDEEPSGFGFIRSFLGCCKGNKVDGLHKLKTYLQAFGYLNYKASANTDVFDNVLESSIKKYQLNYNLNVTGTLDSNTVSMMMMPRCGVPDIVSGTTEEWLGLKSHQHGSNVVHIVSHYAFLPGKPKWHKTRLTYAFKRGTNQDALRSVGRAFNKWASVSRFKFNRTRNFAKANMKVSFERRNHGDGEPFEGPGPNSTVAHAFQPTDGRLHFNAEQRWSTGPQAGAFDIETVALHEIGHLLGLGHSSLNDAIMFPIATRGYTKNLHQDDIQGIKAMYKRK